MERIINFTGELDDELGNYVVNELLDIYDKNKAIIETNERLKYQSDYLPLYADEVEFRINSNGGSLFKFLEIYDLMERMREEQGIIFKGRVSSHAFSAGMYLFCACDYRTMSKFSSLMYHEMSMMRMDKLSDLESETKRMNKIQKILDDIVTRDTGLTQEVLDKYKGRDFWIDFDKAMEYGIIKEEPSEEERLAKALEDMDKEEMTQSEWDAFIEEMKELVNIVPDEPKPTEKEIQDKIKEIEGDTEPDMTLGEAVKEVLGEDFKCNEEVECDEFENRCCYTCENFDKCDKLCEYAEKADICEHMENKLDELDSECENCTCKENKQEDIKECDEPIDCEYHDGEFKCCMYCEEYQNCAYMGKCEYVIEFRKDTDNNQTFDCKYFREESED